MGGVEWSRRRRWMVWDLVVGLTDGWCRGSPKVGYMLRRFVGFGGWTADGWCVENWGSPKIVETFNKVCGVWLQRLPN